MTRRAGTDPHRAARPSSAHSAPIPPAPPRPPERTVKGAIARNTMVLLGSQLVTWGMATLLTIIQPRFLGPEGLGQLRLAFALWAIADVFIAFGIPTIITLQVAQRRVDQELLGRVLGMQLVLYAVSWVAILTFAVAAGYDSATITVTVVAGAASALQILQKVERAVLTGLEKMGTLGMADIVLKGVNLALVVLVLVVIDGGAVEVTVANVIAGAVATAIMFRALHHLGSMRPRFAFGEARRLMRAGWPYLVNDAALVLYLQIDTVVISLLVSETQVGWYASADALFAALLMIPVVLMASIFPVFARLHGDRDALLSLLRQAFATLTLVSVPIGLGTMAIATPFVTLLYGPAFTEAGPVLAILGLVAILTFPTILLGRYAIATGRQRFWGGVMVTAVIASVPLDLVLVPWASRTFDNGAIGGALAYLVTESFMLVMAFWKLAPELLDRPMRIRLAKCFLAGGLMVAAILPVRERFILLPLLVGAVVYVGAIAVLRVATHDEVRLVQRVTGKVMSPLRARLGAGKGR